MLIYLLKDIMCCSFFFDRASIHTEDMFKNTTFSLNKENHFIHYHTHSPSIKKSIIKYLFPSSTCFTLIYTCCSDQFKFFQFYLVFLVLFLIVFDILKEQGEKETLYIL